MSPLTPVQVDRAWNALGNAGNFIGGAIALFAWYQARRAARIGASNAAIIGSVKDSVDGLLASKLATAKDKGWADGKKDEQDAQANREQFVVDQAARDTAARSAAAAPAAAQIVDQPVSVQQSDKQ